MQRRDHLAQAMESRANSTITALMRFAQMRHRLREQRSIREGYQTLDVIDRHVLSRVAHIHTENDAVDVVCDLLRRIRPLRPEGVSWGG